MKNVGHIAAKNVLVLAIASIVYYLVGFGHRVRRRRQRPRRRLGLRAVGRRAARGRRRAVLVVRARSPARPAYLFEVAFAAVSLAIVWGAMAERTQALGVLRVRHRLHADLLARLALGLEPRRLALREGHAGLRRARPSSTTRARSQDSRARCCSARGSASSSDGKPQRDPGPQHGVHHARRDHPLVRLVRLQPGLDAQRRLRRRRVLRLRRAEHEPRRGGGRARGGASRRGS